MLSNLYSYVFGSENVEECSSTECMRTRTKEEDGWLLVHESASGRSSPILISPPRLIELDEISIQSLRAPSPSSIRKAEVLREARAANRMRLNLEKAMFADPPEKVIESRVDNKVSVKASAAKLKRACVSSLVASETKTKNRSAKAAKLLSGANNNRKCNNLA